MTINPSPWTEADLQRLVDAGEQESLQLEFKDARALENTDAVKDEISKDVSSFANSIGGTIIYGIAEGKGKPAKAANISPIDPATISKEWLDQVIVSRIHPRILNVVIHPVSLMTSAPGKVAYAVSVPEGVTAHQASDKRYYKRFNFHSVPMEDYEIRHTMGRMTRPTYQLWLTPWLQASPSGNQLMFRAIILNKSELVGEDCSAFLYLPTAEFGPRPDWETVRIDNATYARTIVTAAMKLMPGSPFQCDTPGPVFPAGKEASFLIIFRISDCHGLAFTRQFILQIPSCKLLPVGDENAEKIASNVRL